MFTIGRAFRICLVTSLLLKATGASARAAPDAADGAVWPGSIQVSSELQRDVDRMLRSSPTFRAQYRRVAEARSVIVGVGVDPSLCEGTNRARSVVRRYRSGLIVVAVTIRRGSGQAEWIAHEFEHILEQIDGG